MGTGENATRMPSGGRTRCARSSSAITTCRTSHSSEFECAASGTPRGSLDWDNLVASFKCIRDGLVEVGVMVDDKPSVLIACEHRWGKAKRGEGRICVRVESAE